MDTKITPHERLDGLEAQRLRDMLASASFNLIWRRVEAEMERSRNICERSDDPRETTRAQGAVHALRAVLALPAMILKEIEERRNTGHP